MWILDKIKNWGIGAAVEALDNLEKPLGEKIQSSIDEFRKLDGYGVAKMIIDEVQELLRDYFKLPPKEEEKPKIFK